MEHPISPAFGSFIPCLHFSSQTSCRSQRTPTIFLSSASSSTPSHIFNNSSPPPRPLFKSSIKPTCPLHHHSSTPYQIHYNSSPPSDSTSNTITISPSTSKHTQVSHSWPILKSRQSLLSSTFFTLLFQQYPHLSPFFPATSKKQQQHLIVTLSYIANIGGRRIPSSSLFELGRRHAHYGVSIDMFHQVGLCLFDAIEITLSDKDNVQDVIDAWKLVYFSATQFARSGHAFYFTEQKSQ
uniref:Globin domain-containing protein n=1 Tax=Timspurckia oligopyrenoides TaxID=708627 RepID=A0A7S0ZIS0_9RHOD|mmetsp:Transcript_6936/g.12425  ORF Transcript_6936/g.12425 Transcript_6936/m.12425 type:complete len:239 (+) Transcript_6936:84-800(+)